MSRITKSIAESVAKKLTDKKLKEIQYLKVELKTLCSSIVESKTDKKVLDFFKEFPEYMNTEMYVYFRGAGLSMYHSVPLLEATPVKSKYIDVESKEAQKVIKLEDKISDKEKEYRDLQRDIEIALLNLKTYNNIQKEFPEAFKLLETASVNTQLVVNVKSIRCKLDKSTC